MPASKQFADCRNIGEVIVLATARAIDAASAFDSDGPLRSIATDATVQIVKLTSEGAPNDDLMDFGWWCYRHRLFEKGVQLPESLVTLYRDDAEWHRQRNMLAQRLREREERRRG